MSFIRLISLDQFGMVESTGNKVSTRLSITWVVIEAPKLHHHDKVTSPEREIFFYLFLIILEKEFLV